MPRESQESKDFTVVEVKNRLKPPSQLNDYEASIWNSVVDSKPADWFGKDTIHTLLSYCTHCTQALLVKQELDKYLNNVDWMLDAEALDRYKKLTDIHEKQTRSINALARSMRLTQQSQYDTQKASRKNKSVGSDKKPWQS